MSNPFTSTFSKAPASTYIPTEQEEMILQDLCSENPSESVYKITGVRGSGKTVILSKIQETLRNEYADSWLVYDLNTNRDLIIQLFANLKKSGWLSPKTKVKGIGLSANIGPIGASVSLGSDDNPFDDVGPLIDEMLSNVKTAGKRVFIGIDEMSKTENMAKFVSEFGRWIRADFPVYLVCTGLYENMMELSSIKNLTFFLRATTMKAVPLNFIKMASTYQKSLSVDIETAKTMANKTKGYAYAFQILGKFYFSKTPNENLSEVLEKVKIELFSYSYEKLYDEMTEMDRFFISLFVEDRSYTREEILKEMGEKSMLYSVYRDRLIKRGLLVSPKYGSLEVALPYFSEYIKEYHPL
ncbi:MAG: hypothetical protein MJ239_06930 [Bacilli bacterium]|nr:hypothetical protein [Bacilli bacterium]